MSRRKQKRREALAVVAATGTDGKGAQIAQLKAKPQDKPSRAGSAHQMPPVSSFIDQDRVGQIKATIRSFEEGSTFEDAAKLADAMLRDDRIMGTTSKRWGALVGSPLDVKPANKKRKAKQIAELLMGSDEQPGLWKKMFPNEVVTESLHWGRFLGAVAIEIMWDYSDPTFSTFTTRVWHPQFLRWNYNRGIYQLRTRDEVIDLPSTEGNIRSDGKWILYTPYGFRAPWRRALLRPLSMLYLCRQWCMRDWSRYSEKHGMPADVVEMPDNAPDDEKAAVMQAIANRGSEAAIFLPVPQDPEARAYKFSVVEPMGRSFETFKLLLDKIETDIAICVLGQNLTTEVKEGSRAAAQVHEGVQFTQMLEDSGIAEVFREQAISHWVVRNWGDVELTPRPGYVIEEPDDELKEAQTLEAVGVALTALQLAGINVDTDAITQIWGIPVHPPGEVDDDETAAPPTGEGNATLTPSALAAIITVNEARAAAGYGPLEGDNGGENPDGHLTVAEFQAKHAETVATAAQAEAGKDGSEGGGEGSEGAPPKPPAKGSQDLGAKEGLATLATKVSTSAGQLVHVQRMAASPGPGVAGHKRMAKYADALKAAAQRRAKAAMSRDLAGILEDVKKASSAEDLKRRLIKRYKGSDATALRRVIERANIMAHMAGRLGVLEEI